MDRCLELLKMARIFVSSHHFDFHSFGAVGTWILIQGDAAIFQPRFIWTDFMRTTAYALIVAALMASTALADSNGTFGTVLNSETQVLGGPFDHGAPAGDASNGTASAIFASTFNATDVLIEGEITGVLAFQGSFFFGEDDIVITDPGAGTLTWQNPAGTLADDGLGTVTAYSATADFAAPVAVNGTWGFEFIDTFDDGAGADSISNNVSVTLQEVTADTDSSGVWSAGALSEGDTHTSVGEFITTGIFDTYSVTINDPGQTLIVETDEDPLGISMGDTVDTEIALFDAAGLMIGYSDDEGNGLYSLMSTAVAAGDYTVLVSGFGSNISAAGVGSLLLADVTGGTSIGDYGITITSVPEPTALSLLAIAGLVGFTRRRR